MNASCATKSKSLSHLKPATRWKHMLQLRPCIPTVGDNNRPQYMHSMPRIGAPPIWHGEFCQIPFNRK